VIGRRVLQVGLGCGLCVLGWAGPLGSASEAEGAATGLAPGVYGRVSDWGEQPPPVLNDQPVQVRKTSGRAADALYLNVPPAERRHWAQHCARHRACATPVYFVDAPRWARLQAARAEPAAQAGEASGTAAAE
jgi:hypothetical protein